MKILDDDGEQVFKGTDFEVLTVVGEKLGLFLTIIDASGEIKIDAAPGWQLLLRGDGDVSVHESLSLLVESI